MFDLNIMCLMEMFSNKLCSKDYLMIVNLTRCVLLGRNMTIAYIFLADDSFPLKHNIMKLYVGAQTKGLRQ
jgi:hypothetical protein